MQALRPLPAPLPVLARLRENIETALQGKTEAVELALVALIAGGHLLIEDVPGVGKTTLARALAKSVGGDMKRIQFTSDLLPIDVVGGSVYDQRRGEFNLRQGPIFANILLADEINRASPRTQSALLEAMNEGQVSIDGQTLPLPEPFFVIATQNSQDFAGTFPLPESQLDRFMLRIRIGYPSAQTESRLLMRTVRDTVQELTTVIDPAQLVTLQRQVMRTGGIEVESSVLDYIMAIVTATRATPAIALGLSTRGAQALIDAARARAFIRGRDYVLVEDVLDLAVPVIAHRIRIAAYAEGFTVGRDEAEVAIRELVARIPLPI